MADIEALTKAIGAHSAWKARLTKAVETGKSDAEPGKVGSDSECDFGKWLYSLPAGDRAGEHWKKVHDLHVLFHKEAGTVLRDALAGKKVEAQKSLALGGSYFKASADLTQAMMAWKSSVKR